jgi:hypothetical protein
MSSTQITVKNNELGKQAKLTVAGSTFTVTQVLDALAADAKGTGTVGLVTEAAQTTLLAASANVIGTVGVPVSLIVKRVNRYTATNTGDTDPATNVKTLDYIPGSEPTGTTALATFVEAFRAAFSAATGGGQVYGLRKPASNSPILSASDPFPLPGAYVFCLVSRYTVRFKEVNDLTIVKDYEFKQSTDVLLNLYTLPSAPFVFPQLFADDGSVTEDNIESKILSGIVSGGKYVALTLYKYRITVPVDTIKTGDPEQLFALYWFEPQLASVVVAELGDSDPLTFTAGNFALFDASGKDMSFSKIIDPAAYTLKAVTTFTIKYPSPGFGSSLTTRAYKTERISNILAKPDLDALDDALAGNVMPVLHDDSSGSVGAYLQMATTVQDLVDASETTLYFKTETFTPVKVTNSYGLNTGTFAIKCPASETFASLEELTLAYFGLEETSDVKYALFEKDTPYKIHQTSEKVVDSAITEFTVQRQVKGRVTGTDGSTKINLWLPQDFDADNMAKYINFDKSALGLTVASLSGDDRHVVHTPGTDVTPFMPWELIKVVAPEFRMTIAVQTTTSLELINDAFEAKAIGDVSIKHNGEQLVRWALYEFPTMDSKKTYVSATRDDTKVPAYIVVEDRGMPYASHQATKKSIYVKEAMAVLISGPVSDGTKPDLNKNLPKTFNMYDLTNYIKTQYNLATLGYAVYLQSDTSQASRGLEETLQDLQSLLPSEVPLKIGSKAVTLARISVVYNNTAYLLQQDMPETNTIAQMLRVATKSVGLASDVALEVVSTSIQPSDLLSKYAAFASSSTSNPKVAEFFVQIMVKIQAVLYDELHRISFNPKVSASDTVRELGELYRRARNIHASDQFKFFDVQAPSVEVDQTRPLSDFDRNLNIDDQNDKLNKQDSAPVFKIVEFNVQSTTLKSEVEVRNLFNIGSAARLSVRAFTTIKELAANAAQSYGYNVGGFGLLEVGRSDLVTETDLVDSKKAYQLVEISRPRQWIGMHVRFVGRSDGVKDQDKVYNSSTKVQSLDGVDALFDFARVGSSTADNLADLSQPISVPAATLGELTLFIVERPKVNVLVNYQGKANTVQITPRATLNDVALSLKIAGGLAITEVATGKTAAITDKLILYGQPYAFNFVDALISRTINVTFSNVTKVVTVKDGNTVQLVIDASRLAFGLPAGSYTLSASGKVLSSSSVPNFVTTKDFVLATGLSTQSMVIIGGALLFAANSVFSLGLF